MDKLSVVNEHTGEEREMGEEQFARVKKRGWKVIPETKKSNPNSETGSDSGSTNETGQPDAIDTLLKGNVNQIVAAIKEYAEAGELEVIKMIGSREARSENPRSTISEAVEKYSQPK